MGASVVCLPASPLPPSARAGGLGGQFVVGSAMAADQDQLALDQDQLARRSQPTADAERTKRQNDSRRRIFEQCDQSPFEVQTALRLLRLLRTRCATGLEGQREQYFSGAPSE